MINSLTLLGTTLTLALFPFVSNAAPAPTNFKGLVGVFMEIITVLIFLIFTLTFIVFAWGIINSWIINPGDESARENGKQIALWGIIALVVMTSIWGILYLLKSSLFG